MPHELVHNSEKQVQVPHLAVPFHFDRRTGHVSAAVNEQDTVEDIVQCVEALFRCPLGHRVDTPDYGRPELALSEGDVDLEELRGLIGRWEPRAEALLREDRSFTDEMATVVRVAVQNPGFVTSEEGEAG